ncbi:MAG: glycosyltransferase family 25 protein [Magnetospirillum sp.]|nr:glycosyltransferase family 25 protein [Magnetospirillum sp.]
MKGYVLNLARRPERLSRFLEWNGGRPGLELEVVPAVEGVGLDRAALVAEGLLDAGHQGFSDGALGNALSHRGQWQACAASGQPRLVFEDDSCLHHSFVAQAPALLRGLEQADMVLFGYNTNAALTLVLPDHMVSAVYFGTAAEVTPDYYRDFAGKAAPRPRSVLHPALMAWGTLAYAVSPHGADRLLRACFPLSSARPVRAHAENREVFPGALDGMVNVALQAGAARALACFPPLALSPNDLSDVEAAPSSSP